jgi:Ca2+-binding EF-hand superfamily protein
MAENGVATHFNDNMFKAFQYFDLDRSGRLDRTEVRRVLDMWNIPVDDRKLSLLFDMIDPDGDGVSYEEFVDHLARGTVAPGAMGKRGMQSKEAMGEDGFKMLDMQLGHNVHEKGFIPSINEQPPEAQVKAKALARNIANVIEAKFKSPAEAFCKIKKKKPNKVTAAELYEAIAEWRVVTTLKETEALVAMLDDNGNGLLDFSEFAQGIIKDGTGRMAP